MKELVVGGNVNPLNAVAQKGSRHSYWTRGGEGQRALHVKQAEEADLHWPLTKIM